MSQQQISVPGTHQNHYRCPVCPFGCDLYETVRDGAPEVMHQHACHRYPSLMTAWHKVT